MNNFQVLGIEQFDSPHDMGSSHGDTRITRQAYYEDPIYVPIAARSQKMIKDLQESTKERLYDEIGAIYFGNPKEELITGVKQSIKQHKLPHTIYDSRTVAGRFPSVKLPEGYELVHEPNAGILYPEKIIETFLRLGRESGNGAIRNRTKYFGYEVRENGVIQVRTDCGNFSTRKLFLSQGIWNYPTIRQLGVSYKIVKQSISWFNMENPEIVRAEKFPVFMGQNDAGRFIYGFPDIGQGLKTTIHDFGEEHQINNDTLNLDREFDRRIQHETREFLRLFLNQEVKSVQKQSTCFYTILPDGDFLIDFLPGNKNVILASCCSGHGFKFCPSLGLDILTMIQSGDYVHERFRLKNPVYQSKL